jgi:hypothetical protein
MQTSNHAQTRRIGDLMTLNRTAMATAAGLSLVLLAGTAAAADAAESSTVTRTAASQTDAATKQVAVVRTAVATKDARVRAGMIRANTGSLTALSVRNLRGYSHTGLVRFTVPALPAGSTLASARLSFNVSRTTRAAVVLKKAFNNWGHQPVRYGASAVGSVVDRSSLSRGQRTLTFDVGSAAHSGTVSFVVSQTRGSSTLRMAANHRVAPRLVLSYRLTSTAAASSGSTAPAPAHAAAPTAPVVAAAPVAVPAGTSASTATSSTVVRIGMSAPTTEWSARLAESGGVDARRIFGDLGSPASAINTATSEVAAGRMPIVSFKVPNNDWAGVAAGTYDAQLRDVTARLAALPGPVFVTLHHEPSGDGTSASYAAMMAHALPILGAPVNVSAGPIVNGFWWSNGNQGLTDAEIAQWLPASVLAVSETVAADTYQGGTTVKPGENAGVKIVNMSAWATRVGVAHLGIGEYNGLDAAAITAAGNAVLADSRFSFAAAFNSNVNNRADVSWQLTGDRLVAFQATVSRARAERVG